MSPYFQPTYADCREQFLTHARAHGATLTSYPIPASGPHGEALTVDTAHIGAEQAAQVLIILSGTHGVEGFAGSACQQQCLAEDFAPASLPADAAVVFVHAVNPFGFAWSRRANENNVDINRNFRDPGTPPPPRPEYVALNHIINPTACSDEADAAFMEAALAVAEEKGMAHLQAVLSNGQYECPEGVYYGGREMEESIQVLRRICRAHAAGAERALLVDFHTGLGQSGEYTILTEHERETPAYAFVEQTFAAGRVESTVGGDSISAELCGELGRGLVAEFTDVELISSACEFGTIAPAQVFQALRHENWLFHHGDRESAQGQAILRAIREAFCPDTDEWRTKILAGGREVLAAAWQGLFGVAPR